MTIDIGSYFIVRIEEPTLSPGTRGILEQIQPIGVHFGADAFLKDAPYEEWVTAFSTLRKDILEATDRKQLLWALDHEGGRVHRTPSPITHFPYPLNWQEHSREVGNIIGKELHSLGINFLFGPAVDIYSNDDNQVIGPRAFGRTADEVIQHATAYIKAVSSQDIVCVIKHFPGHGDTVEDSHFELPTLQLTEEELNSRELKPFVYCFKNSDCAVMNAHIMFPKIDPNFPASLSATITKQILREKLSYQGVITTDDLNMGAIAHHFSAEQLAECIVQSDIDCAVFNHDLERAVTVSQALSTLKIDLSQHNKHRKRIEHLLSRVHHAAPMMLSEKTLKGHSDFSKTFSEKFNPQVKEFIGA